MKLKLLLLFALSFYLSFSQASLVDDFSPGIGGSFPQKFHEHNGILYFTTTIAGFTGEELSYYNGSFVNGVADMNPGAANGSPTDFISYNGNLYFTVDNGVNGKEIWKGNGLAFSMLKDIQPGASNSTPINYVIFNNKIIFSAFTNANGREPWISHDGTSANTVMLKDVIAGSGQSSNPTDFTEFNGELYFIIKSGFVTQIWKTDTTNAGTVLAVNGSAISLSSIENLFVFNNKLYFVGTNAANGAELWESDGTASNTQLVLDLNPGNASSNPQNFTIYNNRLYFTASSAFSGNELFYVGTNGNITQAANINSGAANSFPNNLTVFNGKLYFSADNGVNGVELWETAGTSFSTVMTKDINSVSESTPMNFTEYNGKLYFSADDGVNGRELWVTDGTSNGTVMIANINASGDGDPLELFVFDNELLFSANDDVAGRELWKYKDPNLLSIKDNQLQNSISLYPNPTLISFSIESKHQIKNIMIHDIHGQTVKLFKENLENYNIKDLASGMYFVNIKTDNGSVTKKLIKK